MPLTDLRVVEVGALPAASYCARVFADFGADVVKIEPPQGDPGRGAEPLVATGAGSRESGYFGFLNLRKRSCAIDPAGAGAAARLRGLIERADVLVDSLSAAERAGLGLDHHELRRANPGLIVASLSWFGESGPYRDFAATDAVCRALAGLVQPIGPEQGPPLPLPDFQAALAGGLSAFIAVMAQMQVRDARGGRRFEVSVMEANLAIADYNVALSWAGGAREARRGVNRFAPNFPMSIYPCKRGWIGVTVVTPVQWRGFCGLLGIDDVGADPRYAVNRDRLRNADALEARYKARFLEKTADEWFRLALELKLPMVVVPDMAGLLQTGEHRRRGAFESVAHGARTYEAPASPLRLVLTPPRHGGRVPRPGEHAAEWSRGRKPEVAAAPAAAPAAGDHAVLPLRGVRVVDLSMGWAGPHATRHLADLGADVVKVEACQYPDWWRGVDNRPVVIEQVLYEKSPFFQLLNRNKRGITLDLTTADGVRVLKQLVAGADIVVENYSVGVLTKLGLDYDALRLVNPELIMVSMPAFAADGEWADCRAYGSTLEQASGLPSVGGLPDGPAMNHIAYGDPVGGLNAAAALLIALHHRRRTGRGQRIDLSQVECMLPLVAPWIVEQSANGSLAPKTGARHRSHVPHGSFRCRGEDEWVLIAVTDDAQWAALCRAIGRTDLPPRGAGARRAREAEIERAIGAWTAQHAPDEAMQVLQRAGVPAGVVRAPFDLLKDPHLLARGFWTWIDHPFIGSHPQPAPAYRDGGAPYPIARHSPTLGQHNREVLGDLLSAHEIDRLAEAGVIGTRAVPPSQRKARAAGGASR